MKTVLLACLALLLTFSTVMAEEVRTEIPLGNSPAMGPADAPVTIVEFLDFQ